jgi:hypothetical protein
MNFQIRNVKDFNREYYGKPEEMMTHKGTSRKVGYVLSVHYAEGGTKHIFYWSDYSCRKEQRRLENEYFLTK